MSGTAASGTPASGTPTFLFTDIEGSTRLLQQVGDRYAALLDEHRALIRGAVEHAGGRVFGTEGDALFCAFPAAAAALAAAVEAQRAMAAHAWPEDGVIRVRMGIHSGEAMLAGGDYVGLALHQVARIMSAGHGGQVLVSEATRRLLPSMAEGIKLRDLGERRLKDLAAPERLYQLVADGLADAVPTAAYARRAAQQPARSGDLVRRSRRARGSARRAGRDSAAVVDRTRRHGQDAPRVAARRRGKRRVH